MQLDAILLSFGDELTLGQTVDTNAPWLASQLASRGLIAAEHRCVGDCRSAIARAFTEAAARARIVIATGGLGPTGDDLTREALADALGQPLVEDLGSLAALDAFFTARGKTMPPGNRCQALRPAGARALHNACGTAPGMAARLGHAQVFALPGVPGEMKAMFAGAVIPCLPAAAADAAFLETGILHSFGMAESEVGRRLADLMVRGQNPTVGTTVSGGLCSVRVRASARSDAEAKALLGRTLDEAERRLGQAAVFGRGETTLPASVVAALLSQSQTLVTAESLTGGGLGAAITTVPGASTAYAGGLVAYTDAMKTALLGVPAALLETHGAVSEQAALAMARGALAKSGACLALATTGVAGPESDERGTPVGTVWTALAARDGTACAKLHMFTGGRQDVRGRAVLAGLQMARCRLLGLGP